MQALIPPTQPKPRLLRALRTLLTLSLLLLIIGSLGFAYEYGRYSRVVDRRLAHSALFAARPRVRVVKRTALPGDPIALLKSSYTHPTRSVPAYDALPPQLVAAVVSIEDRHFFEHSGINYARTAQCAVQDALTMHTICGGSTITQQLARVDFLSPRQTLRRKLAEIVIARRLEDRLTKQQIFAMYATQINLGQSGPAPIKGFRQAAQVYFGEDLSQLDLAQCALLAGMIHAPNFDNPYRHPDRAGRRRNVVLDTMVQTGAITQAEAGAAKSEPLNLAILNTRDPASDPQDPALS